MSDAADVTDAPRADPRQLVVGLLAVLLAVLGQLVVVVLIDSTSLPGVWVLYAMPAFGLLGFAGLGIVLTAFMRRG